MKLNFDLLYPNLPVDPEDSFRQASSLFFHKDDGPEVLRMFADQGITWPSGEKATNCQEIMTRHNYEWYQIDCWISHDDYRDICWSGHPKCPTCDPQEREYVLSDVLIDLEPPMPLSLELIFD